MFLRGWGAGARSRWRESFSDSSYPKSGGLAIRFLAVDEVKHLCDSKSLRFSLTTKKHEGIPDKVHCGNHRYLERFVRCGRFPFCYPARVIGRRATFLGVLALCLLSATARAAEHQVCLYLDLGPEFWDASPREYDGYDFEEEYGRNEGDHSYPALRWLARIRDVASDEILFGWDPLDANGCATVSIEGLREVRFEWIRWASWVDGVGSGNQLLGYRCDPATSDCNVLMPRSRTTILDSALMGTDVVFLGDDLEPIDWLFWAATFSEDRFAIMDEQPLNDMSVYISYDPSDLLPYETQANWTFGNQASIVFQGESWHSKFTASHELGHQQTIAAVNPSFPSSDLDYCYDPAVYPLTSMCTANHTMYSHEWQAAAALEGIANWYAVSVWNDVDALECMNCMPNVYLVWPDAADQASAYTVPRGSPWCTQVAQPACPPGVGNEWDWLSAFRLFRLSPSQPSFRTMFRMLSEFYASGSWTANEPNVTFFAGLEQAMSNHLSAAEQADWTAAAATMELER